MNDNRIVCLSLFDGISTGKQALNELNIDCIYYASEIDKYAIAISNYRHNDIIELGDINNWKNWDINWGQIDLIIGGSPCQGLTFAGKKLKLKDPRSSLFFKYVDILNFVKQKNPNVYFFLENVKMDNDSENIFNKLMNVRPYKINSNIVSAQNRQRNYWTNIPNFKMPPNKNIILKDIINDNDNNNYHLSSKHLNGFYKSYKWKPTSLNGKSPTIMASYYKQPPHSPYIECKKSESGYRMLSPLECERLQTLPDNYTQYGNFNGKIKEISKTRRYISIGNGWTKDIIKEFFKHLEGLDYE
jgi:site-specific DNA-cytosine methylase